MVDRDHINALSGIESSAFRDFDVFEPLTPEDFRELADNEELKRFEDTKLLRTWIRPVSRWLQQKYRIDQRDYSASTDPTLAELEEDFSVAVAICIDKFSQNRDQLHGSVTVGRAGGHTWDQLIPPRASQLLARYQRRGGRVGRA